MIRMTKYIFILSCFIFISCSSKKPVDISAKSSDEIFISDTPSTYIDTSKITLQSSDPFYPLKESIHDLQTQILDLKSQVVEYETRLHNPIIDAELIKLIKAPNLKNEIVMNTGTVIQGTIVSENSTQMIVKTQIGQLTIEKEFVTEIREIEPLNPNIEFEGNIEERQSDNLYTYVGQVKNTGGRRADFVRVIYYFWANDTAPIVTDSTFVLCNSTVYVNGVISDASVEPAEIGNFTLTASIPDSIEVEYITKEIKWNIFE